MRRLINFTNAAGATQRGRLNTPRGLAYDSANQRLFIAEGYSSNRVMVFNVATGSMSNGKDADYVLGQTNFTTSTAATTQTGLSRATGLAYDLSTQRLFVAEELNNRITVFNVAPDSMSNGKAADNVLGQTDFTSSASSVAQNKLNLPQGLAYDSDNNRLFALDRNNNRIMIFNVSADSIANGENATDLLGQLDENDQPIYTKSAINNGPNNKGMNFSAYGILDSVNHRFFQEDYYNHRVLVFNLDSDNQFIDHAADYVLGQPDFYHNAAATTQNGFNNPTSFAYDSANQRLFVCDTGNYRVMVFDVSTITNGMNASYVLGQSDFVTKNAVVTQNGFSSYVEGLSLDLDNQRLFVADRNNNRVLVFDLSGGIANGMNASYVLGQPDFVTSSFATNQVGMYYPVVVLYDSVQQRLFVSENKNHRVTVFDVSTIVNGESAINVLGQPDFTHNTAATTQNGLWAPIGLGYDSKDKMLFVNDAGNNRVMIFDLLSLTDGQNAVTNLAQSDFVSKTTGTTADKFKFPDGLDYDPISSRLFSGDSTNHRLLIFEIPKITSTSLSSAIIGQNYSSSISATGGQAPYTCQLTSGSLPTGLSISTDCVISGVPQGSLDYDFTVRVYDSSITSPGTLGLWDDKTYNISEYQGSNEDGDNERDLNVNKVKATSTENSITITWKTDHNAKSIIRYGTDKNLKEKKKDNSKEKKHKIILDNLASDTQYYFRIKAEDGDDNEDRSKVHSIRTLAASNSNPNLNNVAVAKTVTPIYSGNAEPNVCSYTVQTGDSLWTIAQTVYGNGAAYPLIIEKNKEKYSNIASRLSVGQELTFNCGEATVEGVTDTKDDNGVDSPEINQPSSSDSKFRWWNPLSWF